MKRKPKTLARLSQDAAKLMQRIVRIKAANHASQDGYINCVTCGLNEHWSNLQGGHFISRRSMRFRFAEENIHPQCAGCNLYKSGNLVAYTLYMSETYGEDTVRDMLRLSNEPYKISRVSVEGEVKRLQGVLQELEAEAHWA